MKPREQTEDIDKRYAEMLDRRREKRVEQERLTYAQRIDEEEKLEANYRDRFYSLSYDSYFRHALFNVALLIPGFVLGFLDHTESAANLMIFYVFVWAIIFFKTLKPRIFNEENTRLSDSTILAITISIVLLGLFNPKMGQSLLLIWYLTGIAAIMNSISSHKLYGRKYREALNLITFIVWISGLGAINGYIAPYLINSTNLQVSGRANELSTNYEHSYTTTRVWTNKEIGEISKFIEKEKRKRHDNEPFGSD